MDTLRQLRPLIHLACAASTVAALCAVASCDAAGTPVRRPPVQRVFPNTETLRAPGDGPAGVTSSAQTPDVATTPPRFLDAAKADAAPGVTPPSSPASGDRVAAVLLLVPASGKDGGGFAGRRVFRVSLDNDLGDARVELDGRDLPASAIQRVYPQSALLTPAVATRPPGHPAAPRAWRQPSSADLTVRHASTMNPNGAPIID
ncbi:MAG: hypothetical protein ABIW57_04045 [Polyangia bacterium]